MTNSIFNQDQKTNDDTGVDYVEQVKKKFSKEDGAIDVEALIKGKAESDRFVKHILNEKQEMRTELENRLKMEDFLAKLSERPGISNAPEPKGEEKPVENEHNKSALDKDSVMALVREALNTESTKATKTKNIMESKTELEKIFGNNYAQHLEKKAAELGVNKEFFDKLAQESPKALINLVKEPSNSTGNFTPPNSNTNTNAMAGVGNERSSKYYSDLRKNNPKLYWSTSTQSQMYKDATRLGDKFYS